jgi:hypothetical protein
LLLSLQVLAAAPAPTPASVTAAAATALGGADKLRTVRNITLYGYGQYAYQFGGGRITGEAEAPEKYIAANELTRVYDLENDRFQLVERRNMLFPFLGPFGHAWGLNNQVLDGTIAYDINGTNAVRVAAMSDNPLQVDGVHVRRMLMMTNPIALVRAMMDPATKMTARAAGNGSVVDLTLKTGDRMSAAFAQDGLPQWVRWSTRHTNTGQMNFTTHFTGWSDATGNSGLRLPLAYTTRLSYRNVDFLKLYVDAYKINSQIPDLAAPAARARTGGAAVLCGADHHVEADRQGPLARRPGRDDGHRVQGPHRDLRAERQRLGGEGHHRACPHPGARQAGNAVHRQPQPFRPHGGPAPGRGRGPDGYPAEGQRNAVPRHGRACSAPTIRMTSQGRRSR